MLVGRSLLYVSFLAACQDDWQVFCLVSVAFQKSFRIDGRHAARTSGGDRLAIDMILHIAASENTGYFGLGTVMRENVTRRIKIQLSDKEFGIGLVADGNENSVSLEIFALTGLQVLEANTRYSSGFGIAINFFDYSIPDERDLGIFHAHGLA